MSKKTILLKSLIPPNSPIPPIFLLLFLGLAIRLIFVPAPGFEADIAYWKWWGEAASKGPANALNTTSINYPPFFIFVLGAIWKLYTVFAPLETAKNVFQTNTFIFLLIVKLPAILCDLISAGGIYYLIKKVSFKLPYPPLKSSNIQFPKSSNLQIFKSRQFLPLFAAALYLFNPVVIFDSAFWGQTDSIAITLVLLCLLLLLNSKVYLAAALAVIALETKVQTVVFLPLLFLLILRWHGFKKFLECVSAAAAAFLVINLPYILSHLMVRAMALILDSASYFPLASLNAYNLWWLVAKGEGFTTPDTLLILNTFTYKSFGMFLFVIFYALIALYLWKNTKPAKKPQSPLSPLSPIALSFSTAAFAFFMFPTQIHERYIFPVFLFLTIYLALAYQNSKIQASNHKQIQNSHNQNSKLFRIWDLKNWNLFGAWNLFRSWNLFGAWNLEFSAYVILYILLTLSIFLNLHMVLIMNYPENGLPLLNLLNRPGIYLPATILLSWLNLLLFFLLLLPLIKALPKKTLLIVSLISLIAFITPISLNSQNRSRSGVLLSSLKPVSTSQDWGSLEKNTSVDKHLLSSAYVWYNHGLGTHANSRIEYDLNGEYKTFTTDMGIDTEAADNASVQFIILLDNKAVYQTPVLHKWTWPTHTEINVTNAKTLSLIVTDAGDGRNGDHADWLNPKLYR